MNHATSPASVVAWAETRGFAHLCFPADLYAIPGFAIESYWLTPAQETRTHLDAIEAFHQALEDEESRAILRQLLIYRVSTDPRDHPAVTAAEAYVPAFLPIYTRPLTFIDGGAFTGDTLETLLAHCVAVADWIAFEPDSGNMEALRATARTHRTLVGSHTLIQAGLSDTNGLVRFEEGHGAASRIAPPTGIAWAGGSTTELAVVRLDDTIRRAGDIYVKLDIEGAEIDALQGMSRLLAQRPTLAVSLYHRPADLWEIPRLITALYDRPRFRLRQHGHHGFDTVLYVMPG
nr:FkbM family methyltransferase [Methylobacterium sp. BTF04]